MQRVFSLVATAFILEISPPGLRHYKVICNNNNQSLVIDNQTK